MGKYGRGSRRDSMGRGRNLHTFLSYFSYFRLMVIIFLLTYMGGNYTLVITRLLSHARSHVREVFVTHCTHACFR